MPSESVPYEIEYSPDAENHVAGLSARNRGIVLAAIGRMVTHDAESPSRNRKPMEDNPLAEWELRVRDFRVYYVVEEGDPPVVVIRAVGVKVRNRVFIGGEEYDLS